MIKALVINNNDNLGVVLSDLSKGHTIEIGEKEVTLKQDVAAKHKFALKDFLPDEEMYMYGVVVGTAKNKIAKGEVITVENTVHKASDYNANTKSDFKWETPDLRRFSGRTFNGYHRQDGQVGTANYWLVFPLVFCENRNILTIKKAFVKALGYEETDQYELLVSEMVSKYQSNESLEGVLLPAKSERGKSKIFDNIKIKFITHEGGCGGTREDSDTLCRLLAGYLKNANVAGATVFSLGCQHAQIDILKNAIKAVDGQFDKPVLFFDQQETGKESDLMENAIRLTFKELVAANAIERKPAPLSKLTIGLECGGSDGFSGISANPSLGYVSDLITGLGGKAILAEFPELCGVEQELINRMSESKNANKFVSLMESYATAAEEVGSGFDMNPSPGNIRDGLITDAMKSAGAAKKGGTSPVNDVLDYAEYVKADGLSLLCTPGNDVESTTGLAGSGANVVLFTTGLGTPTGNPIVPVLKISSNSVLAKKMPDIIDINAGVFIEGQKSISEMGEEILELVIRIANGEIESKADQLGQDDFIPWKRGVSL